MSSERKIIEMQDRVRRWLDASDKALYKAKANGRDRVQAHR